MKMKTLGLVALGALALTTACSKGSDTLKDGKLDSSATVADSVSYTFGQMAAMQEAQRAQYDSTFNNDARAAFAKGFEQGLDLLKKDDPYFNEGLQAGLNLAMEIEQSNRELGLNLNKDLALAGYKSRKDSAANDIEAAKLQQSLMGLSQRMIQQKSQEKVTAYVKGKKEYKSENGITYRQSKKGSGEVGADKSNIHVRMNLLDKNGKEIMPGAADQVMPVTVGNAPLPQMNKLPGLKVGDVYEIVLTAQDVWGGRAPQGVDNMDVVLLTIERVADSEAAIPGQSGAPDQQAPEN